MNTIFDIEQKHDTPEKLAAAAGKPTKHFLFADEFNQLTDTMKQVVIDTTELDLYWIEKQQRSVNEIVNGQLAVMGTVNLLGVSVKNHDLFTPQSEVKLFIDRYRPRRNVTGHTDIRSSGYKHPEHQSVDYPNRRSEMVLASNNSFIDFAQEEYFKIAGTEPRASGFCRRNTSRNYYQAICHLQFRLQITINNTVYMSKPLAKLSMIMQKKDLDPFVVSYKRP